MILSSVSLIRALQFGLSRKLLSLPPSFVLNSGRTGKTVVEANEEGIRTAAVSDDKKYVATVDEKKVLRVWSLEGEGEWESLSARCVLPFLPHKREADRKEIGNCLKNRLVFDSHTIRHV